MKQHLVKKSKFLSLVLRHKPSAASVRLDGNGWVDIDKLLAGASANGVRISREELDEIVATNEKKRFSVCGETNRIRARQGHSLRVDLQLEQKCPPEVLYHGTATKNLELILKNGLKKMNRHHVHLSSDIETAKKVGMRHGKVVVLEVAAASMHEKGQHFFLSENGVWLVDRVASEYLTVL